MNEERKRVLEMVADGTITASEGARLLEALGSDDPGMDRVKTGRNRRFIDTRAMISEIGPMIQATMGDVLKSRKSFETFDNRDMNEAESVSEQVEEGQVLEIHGDMEKGKAISISLTGSEDSILKASVDNNSAVKVGRKDNRWILLWKSGELRVQIPNCLASVKVTSRGGGISSRGVMVPVELRTMGGGISISKPGAGFSLKTMGGGLDISLDSSWAGNSKAKTMGGGIYIHLTDDASVLLDATTLGGTITAGGNSPEVLSSSGKEYGNSKMLVRYGKGENPPQLKVSTMGGGIVIEGKAYE
jgi:DUF4097 and DUF4098 domain-containing protein YvlB